MDNIRKLSDNSKKFADNIESEHKIYSELCQTLKTIKELQSEIKELSKDMEDYGIPILKDKAQNYIPYNHTDVIDTYILEIQSLFERVEILKEWNKPLRTHIKTLRQLKKVKFNKII